jgi:SAM-dependent methyltransferase
MKSSYVPARYWEEVFQTAYDESAVGYPHLARSLNRARYDVERRNVERALEAVRAEPPRRVLDIGSGTGIWIDFWRHRGAREIVGMDLTQSAVDRLRSRYPSLDILRGDIGEPGIPLPMDMDVVSAMSVLLHITDDARFEQALRNAMRSVRPGGLLALVEPAIVHRWWGPPFGSDSNSKARPLATYERILGEGGFTIAHLRPMSCLLGNVQDTRSLLGFRVLAAYWELLMRGVGPRERLGRVVAGPLRAADLIATRFVPNGPSSKVIIARRS